VVYPRPFKQKKAAGFAFGPPAALTSNSVYERVRQTSLKKLKKLKNTPTLS